MPKTYRLDTHRPMPAGLDQQGRRAVRAFGHQRDFVDTVPTGHGDISAAPEGGMHHDPVPSGTIKRNPLLGLLLVLSGWPLTAALVGICWAVASLLPPLPWI